MNQPCLFQDPAGILEYKTLGLYQSQSFQNLIEMLASRECSYRLLFGL